MPMVYFGEYWDAPAVDAAIAGPTPLGERCVHCPDVIVEGDRGFMMPTVDVGPEGEFVSSVRPTHLECLIRMTVGGVACLEGRCQCRSGTGSPSDETGTTREQGRATMEWLRRHDRST